MHRFDGTAARQLVLDTFIPAGDSGQPLLRRGVRATPPPSLRLLQKDVYAELTRRRRRAQIAARRWV